MSRCWGLLAAVPSRRPGPRRSCRNCSCPALQSRFLQGWGRTGGSREQFIHLPGVAECLKISKAVPKLSECRWQGPSAVPTAGAGLSPLPLYSAGSLQPSKDRVRADHRLFSSIGRLQGILFYWMSFLLPVVRSHPCPRCLFALALVISLSKAPWVRFAVAGELSPRRGLVLWPLSEPGWWYSGRHRCPWKMPWSLGSVSRTEHPGW